MDITILLLLIDIFRTRIHANISREYRYSSDTNYLYSSPVIIQLPKHDCSIELFLDLFRPMRRFDLDTKPRETTITVVRARAKHACFDHSWNPFFRVLWENLPAATREKTVRGYRHEFVMRINIYIYIYYVHACAYTFVCNRHSFVPSRTLSSSRRCSSFYLSFSYSALSITFLGVYTGFNGIVMRRRRLRGSL